MIDYHCHLLPGLDDGPQTVSESLDMARQLAAFGFREVCCTPHCIKGHYEISPVEVRNEVRRLQSCFAGEGIPLLLHSGMEYYLDEFFEQFAGNLLPLGESRLVLCEAPPQAHPGLVVEMIDLIVVQGFVPLIAHPERSDVIWDLLENQGLGTGDSGLEHKDRGLGAGGSGLDQTQDKSWQEQPRAAKPFWKRLISARFFSSPQPPAPSPQHLAPDLPDLPDISLFQANLGSFAGFYGVKPQRRAYELLQRGVYNCLASDLHDARSASQYLEIAREKLNFNPALQKLGEFKAPPGDGGGRQLGFW